MSRARAEQTSTGNALLVVVGLGMLFLLFTAFLGSDEGARRTDLWREQHALRGTDFLRRRWRAVHGIRRDRHRRYVNFASLSTAIGFGANTLGVAHRWYLAGHPPFASIYEMLLSFVWTVAR